MTEKNPRYREIFGDFIDPISMVELMNDPVTFSSGKTYDRELIRNWANTSRKGDYFPDPLTRRPLHINELGNETNTVIKNQIEKTLVSAEEAVAHREKKQKENQRMVSCSPSPSPLRSRGLYAVHAVDNLKKRSHSVEQQMGNRVRFHSK